MNSLKEKFHKVHQRTHYIVIFVSMIFHFVESDKGVEELSSFLLNENLQ